MNNKLERFGKKLIKVLILEYTGWAGEHHKKT
jgi:hypothetical protein